MQWPNIFLTFIVVIEHSKAITSPLDAIVFLINITLFSLT